MKVLLFLNFFFSLFGLFSQEILPLSSDISVFSKSKYVYLPKDEIRFKDYGDTWFSTVNDLVNIYAIPPLSSDPWGQKALLASVFPDTTIITGVDPITKKVYRPFIHGMADIINPSKTPSQWVAEWADVLIDSLEIPFVYTRATHDSVIDTMFVDYLVSRPDQNLVYYDLNQNSTPDFGEFLHQPIFHSDTSTNKLDDGQIFRTDTILLTPSDSSFMENVAVKFKGIDVNDSVKRTERYGVYIRFQPGYKWKLSDTINYFNEFSLLTREQTENNLPNQIWSNKSGFCSYTLHSAVRYNSFNNSSSYFLIPGIIQLADWQLEHLIINYKLTSNTLFKGEIETVSSLKLFPNPVNDVLNVRFSIKHPETLNISVFDLTGKEVFQDELKAGTNKDNIYRLKTDFLNSGIYSIRVGEFSNRFIVK